MLQSFYGLAEAPFELTANPRFLFLAAQYRETLSNLECGLSWAEAITVLIGEAGTGKSMLLRAALESDRCRQVSCVFLDNPTLTRDELVETLALRFNLGAHAGRSKGGVLGGLESAVRDRQARGQVTGLVVDEAQAMPDELVEEIRVLANMETHTGKLMPVVFVGQPELMARWSEPGLMQLKERVALRCELKPLDLPGTAGYIASRIRTAGGDPGRIFTREAVTLIHELLARGATDDQRDLPQRPDVRVRPRSATARLRDRARSVPGLRSESGRRQTSTGGCAPDACRAGPTRELCRGSGSEKGRSVNRAKRAVGLAAGTLLLTLPVTAGQYENPASWLIDHWRTGTGQAIRCRVLPPAMSQPNPSSADAS